MNNSDDPQVWRAADPLAAFRAWRASLPAGAHSARIPGLPRPKPLNLERIDKAARRSLKRMAEREAASGWPHVHPRLIPALASRLDQDFRVFEEGLPSPDSLVDAIFSPAERHELLHQSYPTRGAIAYLRSFDSLEESSLLDQYLAILKVPRADREDVIDCFADADTRGLAEEEWSGLQALRAWAATQPTSPTRSGYTVYVWSLTRLGRAREDVDETLAILRAVGVEVRVVADAARCDGGAS